MTDGAGFDALIGVVGVVIGAMIGGTGLGGVLLAPALDLLGQTTVHNAVPICMLVFIFSGLAGTAIYSRRKVVRWSSLVSLSIGACPAAFIGAATVSSVPADLLKVAIAIMVIAAGIQAFALRKPQAAAAEEPGSGKLIVLGALVGFGSSLTGSGGPLLLLPILIFTGANLLQSVGLSQAIQIPIGVFATASNLMYGRIDLSLGFRVAVAVVIGVCIGAYFAQNHSAGVVKLWIPALLVGSGVLYGSLALVG